MEFFRPIWFLDIYVPKSEFKFVKVEGLICYYCKGRKVELFILNSSLMAKRQKEKRIKSLAG